MVDEVGADLGVSARLTGKQNLGADSIGAGNQHRTLVAAGVKGKQAAERSDAGQHFRTLGRFGKRLDQLDRPISGVDADARVPVSGHDGTVSSASLSISSWTGTGTG